MAAPFDLRVTYGDGTVDTIHQTPKVWAANQRSAAVAISTKKTVKSVEAMGGIWVDADGTNNKWPQ
jgi:hypothetical protein